MITNKDLKGQLDQLSFKLDEHIETSDAYRVNTAKQGTDIEWIKKGMWVVIGVALTQMAVELFK